MAKLNKDKAEAAAKASGSFEPVPAGVYHARLDDVDTDRSGGAGPYWSWAFTIVEPGEHAGRRQWNNTSLSEAALFKVKETFEAFGVPTDTDTDELCGRIVKLQVSVRTIQAGARKGEPGNQVDRVLPADEDFEAPAGAKSVQEEDIFQ